MTVKHDMLLIQSLDPWAHISLSPVTGGWYVHARIEVGGDGMLSSGGAAHAPSPDAAVAAYLHWLQTIDRNEYLVTRPAPGERRHHRWNGAGFAEIPKEIVT